MAQEKNKKRASTKKHPFPWILDTDNNAGKLILVGNDEILEYIRTNILEAMYPGQEVSIKLGITKMTGKQFQNLPDIDEL